MQLPDGPNLELRNRLYFVPRLAVVIVIPIGVEVVARCALFAHHVEIDADLEESDRRQQSVALGAGHPGHLLDCGIEALVGGHGHGKPQVESAVSGVVVAHAGVLVDRPGARVQLFRPEAHRDQNSLVSEAPSVEDRADLADDVRLLHTSDAVDGLGRVQADPLP